MANLPLEAAFTLHFGDDADVLAAQPGLAQALGLAPLGLLRAWHDPPHTRHELLLDLRPHDDHPEFLPLLHDASGDRYGCWLDEPRQRPSFVVRQPAAQPGSYECVGRHLFELLRLRLEQLVEAGAAPPAEAALRMQILTYATDARPETGGEYVELYEWKAEAVRRQLAQAPTPDGMGVVLPLGTFRMAALAAAVQGGLTAMPAAEVAALAAAALAEDMPGMALFYLKSRWPAPGSADWAAWHPLLAHTYRQLGRGLLAERLPVPAGQ